MRTEISTAAAFVTRLLRAGGGIGEEQLRCFRECLQEALCGERGRWEPAGRGRVGSSSPSLAPLPLLRQGGGIRGAQAPRGCRAVGLRGRGKAALCSLPQSTTSTTGSPWCPPRAPGTDAFGSTIRWTP